MPEKRTKEVLLVNGRGNVVQDINRLSNPLMIYLTERKKAHWEKKGQSFPTSVGPGSSPLETKANTPAFDDRKKGGRGKRSSDGR